MKLGMNVYVKLVIILLEVLLIVMGNVAVDVLIVLTIVINVLNAMPLKIENYYPVITFALANQGFLMSLDKMLVQVYYNIL